MCRLGMRDYTIRQFAGKKCGEAQGMDIKERATVAGDLTDAMRAKLADLPHTYLDEYSEWSGAGEDGNQPCVCVCGGLKMDASHPYEWHRIMEEWSEAMLGFDRRYVLNSTLIRSSFTHLGSSSCRVDQRAWSLSMGRLTRSRLIEDMHPNDITVMSAFQGVPSTSAHKPYISKEHHHAQGALNVVVAGEKTWVLFDFCRPGQRTTVHQTEGQWLWLPPGWQHHVTSHDGREFFVQKTARRVNVTLD
jgi:hypothetical protein